MSIRGRIILSSEGICSFEKGHMIIFMSRSVMRRKNHIKIIHLVAKIIMEVEIKSVEENRLVFNSQIACLKIDVCNPELKF